MEGPTRDEAVLLLRDRMRRNAMATLLLSHGTPMLLMGDEVGRTQFGNNNAYCQDEEMCFLPWEHIPERDFAFFRFTHGLIRLRGELGLLRPERFLHGDPVDASGLRSVTWLRPDGAEMTPPDWTNGHPRVVGLVLADAEGERLLFLFSAHDRPIGFRVPPVAGVGSWRLRVDCARGLVDPDEAPVAPGIQLHLPERALLLYQGLAE